MLGISFNLRRLVQLPRGHGLVQAWTLMAVWSYHNPRRPLPSIGIWLALPSSRKARLDRAIPVGHQAPTGHRVNGK